MKLAKTIREYTDKQLATFAESDNIKTATQAKVEIERRKSAEKHPAKKTTKTPAKKTTRKRKPKAETVVEEAKSETSGDSQE